MLEDHCAGQGDRLRLFTRNGYDFTIRFPKIVSAVAALPARSCVVDGEAIVVNRQGLSVFDLLRYRHHDHAAVLCAFDLIELDGFDLRQQALERRKDMLADLLRAAGDGIAFNKHFAGDRRRPPQQQCMSAGHTGFRNGHH
jgi:bifunctional non-homologous end joining protein LigD